MKTLSVGDRKGVPADKPTGLEQVATMTRRAAARILNKTTAPATKRTLSTAASKPAESQVSKSAGNRTSTSAQSDATIQKSGEPDPMPLAVEIGWTMALLFGQTRNNSEEQSDRLPSEHELPHDQRIELEVKRVNTLLDRLGSMLPELASHEADIPQVILPASLAVTAVAARSLGYAKKNRILLSSQKLHAGRRASNSGTPHVAHGEANGGKPLEDPAETGSGTETQKFHEGLKIINQEILIWLACAGREFSLAYQLGRSLRDTANPPLRPHSGTGDVKQDKTQAERESKLIVYDAVWTQLSRARVSKLQEWLSTLAAHLPENSAAIVSVSIGRWCDLSTTIFDKESPGKLRGSTPLSRHAQAAVGSMLPSQQFAKASLKKDPPELDVAEKLYTSLLPQGDAWLNLLVGAESPTSLLTPEGYVAAGEAALGRSARIIKEIARHYWFLLLIGVIALACVLYFAAHDLDGASKLWTQIAAVAGTLGVTAKGIGNRMTKLSADAGKSIFAAEETDAMAWAVTCIPTELKLNNQGVRALRRGGILQSAPLGRV